MKRFIHLPARWGNAPAAILVMVALLVLAGFTVVFQGERTSRELQAEEARVQAEILAASVTAAVDFGDTAAAQEAVDAMRANRQLRTVGVYDGDGRLIAGYGRGRSTPTATFDPQAPARVALVQSNVPVMSGGARIGTIILTADPEPLSRRISRYLVILFLVLMALLVVIVLGISQNALRRANRELAERADALSEANAELLIQIGEREKAEDQLRQAQKLQALGQLTGGIAHDFNNLLTVIQGSADMLRRPGLAEPKKTRLAEAIVQAASRAAALTGQLLAFARRQPLQPEVIDVNALIGGMIDLLDRTLGERISVRTELADKTCTVEADRAQLESALLNIAVNARDAMPDGGALLIGTAFFEGEDGARMIGISVSDSGSGMDSDTLSRAIEPFFTTKATGKGTGLGLSQVYGFATQSGGDVRIISAPGAGTTVTLLLPCSGAQSVGTVPAGVGRIESRRSGRILLVEDNEEVGAFAAILLGELGHEVVRARSGRKALEIAADERFDAVFSDVVMPGMSGLELADALAEAHPDLPVILTTGYSDEIAESGAGGRMVILKPYKLETLAAALDRVLAGESRGPG